MGQLTPGPRSARDFPKIPSANSPAEAHEEFLKRISLRAVNKCPDLDRKGKKQYRIAIGVAKKVLGPRLKQSFRGRFMR